MDTCTYTYTKFLLEMAIYICMCQPALATSQLHTCARSYSQAGGQDKVMCITEHHYDNYYTKYSCTTFDDDILYMNDSIRSYQSLSSLAEKQGPSYAIIATNLFLHNSIVFPNKSYLILKYAQSSQNLNIYEVLLCPLVDSCTLVNEPCKIFEIIQIPYPLVAKDTCR